MMAPDKTIPLLYTEECGYVPTVLVNAGELIERDITTKDLFQVQSSSAKVKQLLNILSVQKMPRLHQIHVHDVVEVIKVCLSHLSKEIIPHHVLNLLIEAYQSQIKDYTEILMLFRRTSPLTFSAVHYVMRLLNKIAQNSETNGMSARKLATIFVLDILKSLTASEEDDPQASDVLRLHQVEKLPYLIMVIEQLILNVSFFKAGSTDSYTAQIGDDTNKDIVKETQHKPAETSSNVTDTARAASCHSLKRVPLVCSRSAGQLGGRYGPTTLATVKMENVRDRYVREEKPIPKRENSTLTKSRAGMRKRSGNQVQKRRASVWKSASGSSGKEPPRRNAEGKATTSMTMSSGKIPPVSLFPTRPRTKKHSLIKRRLVLKRSPPGQNTVLAKEESAHRGKSPKRTIFYLKGNRIKSRTRNRKRSVPRKTRPKGDFLQDEELLPWTNVQSEDDDSSTMQRTIQHPHVHLGRFSSPTVRWGNSSENSSQAPKWDPPAKNQQHSPGAAGKFCVSGDNNCGKPQQTNLNVYNLSYEGKSPTVFNCISTPPNNSSMSQRCHTESVSFFAQIQQFLQSQTSGRRSCTPRNKRFLKDRQRKAQMLLMKSQHEQRKCGRSRYLEGLVGVFLLSLALLCTYPLYLLLKMTYGESRCHGSQRDGFLLLRGMGLCNNNSMHKFVI